MVSVKPDLGEHISTLLKSKAGSTAKRFKKEILKFIDCCNFFRDWAGASFSCFVYSYLSFKVYKSSSSYASLVMTHAALKWFHSFDLSNGANLFYPRGVLPIMAYTERFLPKEVPFHASGI